MSLRRGILPAAAAVFVLLPSGSPAHHQLDEVYERDSAVTLSGTVIRIDWVNPHASFTLSVAASPASTVEWIVELDPPHVLQRQGWTRETIVVGRTVAVEGFRALDGAPRTYAKTVTLEDGMTLPASSDASWNWRRIN